MGKLGIVGILALVLISIALVLFQFWIVSESQIRIQAAIEQINNLQNAQIGDERTRQELIGLRIENEQRSLALQNIVTNIATIVGVVVGLSGAWVGILQFLSIRRKDQLDRASLEFNSLWEQITNKDQNIRARSIVGLQQFLLPSRKDFHEKALLALALSGRMGNSHETVKQALTPVIEYAARQLPSLFKRTSWQGIKLYKPNFSNADLEGVDFRDADIYEADFSGANLRNARLDALVCVACKFDRADMSFAILEYADLANASLRNANLSYANLRNIRLLDSDWSEANLRNAVLSKYSTDWRLAKNWRSATFDDPVKTELLAKLGPSISGPRILMLMWEFSPIVSGGGWTAAYHLIRRLRRLGSNITVIVPHAPSVIDRTEFGNEVEVIAVGTEDADATSKSSFGYLEPYRITRGSKPAKTSSVFARSDDKEIETYNYGSHSYEKITEFTRRVNEVIEERELAFDLIHAQDWITFETADVISDTLKIPWIAHFHSIESDRNRWPQLATSYIERRASHEANVIITPSSFTKRRIVEIYGTDPQNIVVIPNCLSRESNEYLASGRYESQTVLFMGRVSWQKGPDNFLAVAQEVAIQSPSVRFQIVGEGDMLEQLQEDAFVYELDEPFAVDGDESATEETASTRFTSICPILLNANDNSYTKLGEAIDKEERISLSMAIVRRGYTVFPIIEDNDKSSSRYSATSFTHRIVVNHADDNFHLHYLVRATSLRRLQGRRRDVIEFMGYQDWKDRKQPLSNASIVIVPSRFEPFGMIVLEAMEVGVPVLYSNTAGVCEFVKEGIQIDSDDPVSVARQVMELLKDENLWLKISNAERQEIAEYYNRGYEKLILDTWNGLLRR